MRKLLKKGELKVFFKAGFLLTTASVIVGILGYFFQILVGRMLEPADFAVFSALMALYILLGSPFSALNMLITRHVSILRATKHTQDGKHYYWVLQKWVIVVGLIVLLIFYFTSDFFIEYLKAQSLSQLLIFSTLLIFSSLLVVNNSFFQGFQLFGWQALSNVFSASMKLLLSVGFIVIGMGVSGAILGVSLSAAFAWIIGVWILWSSFSKFKDDSNEAADKNITNHQGLFQVLSVSISFALMTQLDMILVNWFFNPSDAGDYAAASVLGKAVLYIPSGLIIALFPMTIEAHLNKTRGSLLLKAALISTFCICGALALLYSFWGNEIIGLIYGEAYSGAGSILRWYGFAILPMALVMVYEHYLIAKGKMIFSWVFLIFGPLQIAAIYLWHDKLIYVLAAVGGSGLLLFLCGSFMSYRYLKDNSQILLK
jgi:O-antigen/teichoic acid export membrane protein